MSEKDMLEEWEKDNHKNTVFYDGKASDGKTIYTEYPELRPLSDDSTLATKTTEKSKGHVSYEVDYDGNLKKAAVSYNIDGRQYTVSMAVKHWGFGEDHIRLEIRRKGKNPLKNLFKNNLLASSVTPIRIKAYEKGCLWTHLKNNNIEYPSDPHYKGLVDAAFADIKGMSHEIEEKMDYMKHYNDRIRDMERQQNKQDLLEQDLREQAKLKGKNNEDIKLINILISDRNKKR